MKQELAKLSNSIQAIPRTFKMPEEYASWQGFVNAEEGSGMEWIQKSTAHRGVQIITDTAAPELQQLQGVLVQQLVRPRLIGGRAWDVGGCMWVHAWVRSPVVGSSRCNRILNGAVQQHLTLGIGMHPCCDAVTTCSGIAHALLTMGFAVCLCHLSTGVNRTSQVELPPCVEWVGMLHMHSMT